LRSIAFHCLEGEIDGPFLHMRAICKAFPGVLALDHAELAARFGRVMALVGANGAGKSTLMNILGGIVSRDSGEIVIAGRSIALRTPIESLQAGIAFVQQELNSLPTMSISENIFIDAFPQRLGRIDTAECLRRSRRLLQRLGSDVDPATTVGDLSLGDRQLVEIARALRRDPKLLIFDEPTSSLSGRERGKLLDVVRGLKAEGVAIIYISHFLDEIFAVSDDLVVMRNGRTVFSGETRSLSERELVRHMMGGRENEAQLQKRQPAPPIELLRVEGLSRGDALKDVTVTLGAGEVVGLWGLLGAGRTELLRALVGLDPIDSGELSWSEKGRTRSISPGELSLRAGFVTEDRRNEGLFLGMSVGDNIVMPNLDVISRFGLVRGGEQRRIVAAMTKRLGIKTSAQEQKVATLSGGNQQKVVFARWLVSAPKLLLLDEPTRGLDVDAKTEILRLVTGLAEAGTAVLLVSSELEELTRVCNRYLVMVRGRIVTELPSEATREQLVNALSLTTRQDVAA
jgi:ABC-type sugar transport system ATPase subunit